MRITGGPAFPFAQPVLWSRDYRSSAAQLVRQRPAVKRNQVERLRQQLLSQGVRGAETAYIQRSALANMPKTRSHQQRYERDFLSRFCFEG